MHAATNTHLGFVEDNMTSNLIRVTSSALLALAGALPNAVSAKATDYKASVHVVPASLGIPADAIRGTVFYARNRGRLKRNNDRFARPLPAADTDRRGGSGRYFGVYHQAGTL